MKKKGTKIYTKKDSLLEQADKLKEQRSAFKKLYRGGRARGG